MSNKSTRFSLPNEIEHFGEKYRASDLVSALSPLVTPQRLIALEQVASRRNFDIAVVCENLYDTGNINAVMRSAENFGFANFHIIESQYTKISARTTQGAHKWLHVQKWKETESCLKNLKEKGHRIVVTSLAENSSSFLDLDFSVPTAIIFGNEKDGISAKASELADEHCILPTVGFTQSFNVSVAAALCLHYAFIKSHKERVLDPEEFKILMGHYLYRSCTHMHKTANTLKALIERS